MGGRIDQLFCSKPWRVGWDIISGTLLFVLICGICISAADHMGGGLFVWLAVILLLPALVLFWTTLLHALVHAMAAWACGHHVHKVNVLGLSFLPHAKGWARFRISQKDFLDGYVANSPKFQRGGLWKDVCIAAAGSVANLVVGVALIVFSLTVSATTPALPILIGSIGLFSSCIGLRNLVPAGETGKWSNKGLNIFRCLVQLKNGERASELEYALDRLDSFIRYEGQPDLRDALVVATNRTDTGVAGDWFDRIIAHVCFSEANLPFALEALLRLQSAPGGLDYATDRMRLAFALALVRRDVQGATLLMQTINSADRTTNSAFSYFSAAISQVAGDHEGALNWLQNMRAVGEKYGARHDNEDIALIARIENNDDLRNYISGSHSEFV